MSISSEALLKWHQLVAEKDFSSLDTVLADNVVFYSPVVHTPQVGKEITKMYLFAAFQVLCNDTFKYVREVAGEKDAVLEFDVEIDGVIVDGVDMITWDEHGLISEFKVMVRPLKAINTLHQLMMKELQALEQKS
ncbi:MAG: nuclear transport factor 2 family protein [Pseudomonadales bacterium]|nr:MAG: nuclear transport factor 2 family protein [Pseudomonadales bacterium]